MGSRGPIPKRSEDRRGHRAKEETAALTRARGADQVTIPEADESWHPIAVRLWEALAASGQTRFYEPSDWAFAYSLMEDLSAYKNSPRRSGQMLAAIMSGLSDLLVTEGDRRRVGIELTRPEVEERERTPGEDELAKWRERLRA